MRAAAVALHLQSLGPLPVEHQSGCCSPAPTTTGAPTCTTSERLLHWGSYLYDIRAAAVALHLQPLGLRCVRYQSGCCSPALTATGAPTCTISERLLHWSPYLYNNSADAVALHLQLLEPLPVQYQSGCCSPAPTATGPRPARYKRGCCSLAPTATGPLPVRYLSGCCSPAPTATGALPLRYQRGCCSPAATATGALPVRYQSCCCSPPPTATEAPTCTILERLL
ncbi:hypothetical protein RRG08_055780 [Elysia crispata]|nr:hypothetical protein RRG08_055780 [Elysia crispata]